MLPLRRLHSLRKNKKPSAWLPTIPRPSLEERYHNHAGYVAAVRAAAKKAVADRYLLPDDADRLIAQAEASNVLAEK